MRIICFPYAFGNSTLYSEFGEIFSEPYKIESLDYPGHGQRVSDKLLFKIDEIVDDAFNLIRDKLSVPYCLFGYSMGGLVVYELCILIQKMGLPMPKHIFILGTPAPSIKRVYRDYENYGLEDVRRTLNKYGETPKELLECDDMIEYMIPSVKADLIALRDYSCNKKDLLSFGKNVTVIRGCLEPDSILCRKEWKKFLGNDCEFLIEKGNHFFMFKNGRKMLEKIRDIVMERAEK